jgi:uncharacterized membrane protein YdcZ (DUF606 family)
MLNLSILIAYCVLLVAFLFISVLAIQHTAKFGYISRRFKVLAWVFGLVAFALVLFSIYLIANLFKPDSTVLSPVPTTKNIDY